VLQVRNLFRNPGRLGARCVEVLLTVYTPQEDITDTQDDLPPVTDKQDQIRQKERMKHLFVEEVNGHGRVHLNPDTGQLDFLSPARFFAKKFWHENGRCDKPLANLADPAAAYAALRDAAEAISFLQAPTVVLCHYHDREPWNVEHAAWLKELRLSRAELIATLLVEGGVPESLLRTEIRESDEERISLYLKLPKEDASSLDLQRKKEPRKEVKLVPHVCELRLEEVHFHAAHAQAYPHWLLFEERLRSTYKPLLVHMGGTKCSPNIDGLVSLALNALALPPEGGALRQFRRGLAKKYGSTINAWRQVTSGSQRRLTFDRFRDSLCLGPNRVHAVELWMELLTWSGGTPTHISLFDLDPDATAFLVDVRGLLLKQFGERDRDSGKFQVQTQTMCERLLGQQNHNASGSAEHSWLHAGRKQLAITQALKHFVGGGQTGDRLIQLLDHDQGHPAEVTSADFEWLLMRLPLLVECDAVTQHYVDQAKEEAVCTVPDVLWWTRPWGPPQVPESVATALPQVSGIALVEGGRTAWPPSGVDGGRGVTFLARTRDQDVANAALAFSSGDAGKSEVVQSDGRFASATGLGNRFVADFCEGVFQPLESSKLEGKRVQASGKNKMRCVAPRWCGQRCVFTYAADKDVWIQHNDSSNEEVYWKRILEVDHLQGEAF
jgi:hypothetical protein